MLVLVLGDSLYAVSYTPTTYVPTSYTSSYTSTTDPSMAAIRKLATTTNDADDVGEGEIPNPWAETNDIEDEMEIPNSWSEPSPLGDGWILLLFALAYAAYVAIGTIHTRLRQE